MKFLSEWQRTTLTLLVEKYEKSVTYMGKNQVEQRFFTVPSVVFPEYNSDFVDLDKVREFELQMRDLEKQGLILIQIESGVIVKLFAASEKWDEYYKLLEIEEKKNIQKRQLSVYERYAECSLLQKFGMEQCDRIRSGKSPKFDVEKAENILKLCLFLEKNAEEIMERELSAAVLGDTKLWETKYRNIVCGLIRNIGKYDDLLDGVEEKREREVVLLEEFHVFANPAYVWLKGDAEILCRDGRKIRIYRDLPLALPFEVLNEAEKLLIHAETIMTVENLTAFNRMNLDGIFFVFLSGYHSRIKQKLIQMIAGENKDKTWMHFGDIDPDGFDIVRHLERSTGITFELYRMGCAELKKYQKYTKKLNQNDRAKTEELLKIERYRETVEYMMEHDCKLEQEIISWSESQKSAAKIKI